MVSGVDLALVESTPHSHAQAPARAQGAAHFLECLAAVWKELKSLLAEHDVK
jgi:tRNA C32,U32 (ribose-2'-O)-methylase TrmJ